MCIRERKSPAFWKNEIFGQDYHTKPPAVTRELIQIQDGFEPTCKHLITNPLIKNKNKRSDYYEGSKMAFLHFHIAVSRFLRYQRASREGVCCNAGYPEPRQTSR